MRSNQISELNCYHEIYQYFLYIYWVGGQSRHYLHTPGKQYCYRFESFCAYVGNLGEIRWEGEGEGAPSWPPGPLSSRRPPGQPVLPPALAPSFYLHVRKGGPRLHRQSVQSKWTKWNERVGGGGKRQTMTKNSHKTPSEKILGRNKINKRLFSIPHAAAGSSGDSEAGKIFAQVENASSRVECSVRPHPHAWIPRTRTACGLPPSRLWFPVWQTNSYWSRQTPAPCGPRLWQSLYHGIWSPRTSGAAPACCLLHCLGQQRCPPRCHSGLPPRSRNLHVQSTMWRWRGKSPFANTPPLSAFPKVLVQNYNLKTKCTGTLLSTVNNIELGQRTENVGARANSSSNFFWARMSFPLDVVKRSFRIRGEIHIEQMWSLQMKECYQNNSCN